MDIGLNWNEWHQEAARKPYVRVGVTLLSGALILMPAQEIVSLYLEKNLISEIPQSWQSKPQVFHRKPESLSAR